MENTPLNNVVIEITEEAGRSKTQYGISLKLKGKDLETGKTNTYTIYDKKADGSLSAAWNAYGNGALLGQTVQVGYATKEGTLQDGSPYTQRIIRTINPDIGNGVANSVAQGKTPLSEANKPLKNDSDEQYWDKKAYKQCLWNFWLETQARGSVFTTSWKDQVWNIFKEIEADADKRFATGWAKAENIFKKDEELPTIDINEEPPLDSFAEDLASQVPF